MKLDEIYQTIGSNMLQEFEHLQTQIKHMGERGREREAVLESFLTKYLPTRYGISTGEIVDSTGKTSHQCDLIIYDHFNCPLLLAGNNIRIFPAESVLAVIEVKSTLSKAELVDATQKIKHLKELQRENHPVPGIIFAYKPIWKKDPIEKIASELQKIYKDFDSYQFVDLICILNSGVIELDTLYDWPEAVYETNTKNRFMLAHVKFDIPILFWFYTKLLELLTSQNTQQVNLHYYLGLAAKYGKMGLTKKIGINQVG
jgi:hypothetical protein